MNIFTNLSMYRPETLLNDFLARRILQKGFSQYQLPKSEVGSVYIHSALHKYQKL